MAELTKEPTIREMVGDEQAKSMHEALDATLDAKWGAVVIINGDERKITDYYQGMCPECVITRVTDSVTDFAVRFGLPLPGECDE